MTGQPFYFKNNILCHDLAGFGWIWLDLAGFGGLVNPGLGGVVALVDEVLAEGGGPPEIAAKRRKSDALTPPLSQWERGKSFAFFALFRG
jgi:hypothetical protein